VREEDITNCKIKPTVNTFINMNESVTSSDHEQSFDGWCEICSRAYHRHCDDLFDQLRIKHNLYINKEDLQSLDHLKSECNVPLHLSKMSKHDILQLKDKMSDIMTTCSNCRRIRYNHHNHCIREKNTHKSGGDKGHQDVINTLSNISKSCNTNLNYIRKTRTDVPGSYEKEQMNRLKSRKRRKTSRKQTSRRKSKTSRKQRSRRKNTSRRIRSIHIDKKQKRLIVF
jgi:hypothetical protein